jgi:hypothetical protein
MENYKKYISEIRRFEMALVKCPPQPGPLNNIKNISPEQLQTLMGQALADIGRLPLEEVKKKLTGIMHLEKIFSDIDAGYPSLFGKIRNKNLASEEFFLKLEPLFGPVRPDPEVLTRKFMVGLYISILKKQQSVLAFELKIQNLLKARPVLKSAEIN